MDVNVGAVDTCLVARLVEQVQVGIRQFATLIVEVRIGLWIYYDG